MERLSWQEMTQRYPDEWLVIVDFQTDDRGRLISGVVERHSVDMYKAALPAVVGRPTAFRYTGESTFRGLRSHAHDHAL